MADLITVLFFKQSSDDPGSGIVDEGFTGGLNESIKHGAELFLDEMSHILAVVGDIILHHPCQNSTKCAGIIKTVLVPQLPEISTGTSLLQAMQFHIDILVTLYPSRRGEHMHQFLHEVWAAQGRCGRDVGVWEVELFIECLGLDEHLHEDGVGLAGLSCGVVLLDIDDVLLKMPQDMCANNAYQEQQHQQFQLH